MLVQELGPRKIDRMLTPVVPSSSGLRLGDVTQRSRPSRNASGSSDILCRIVEVQPSIWPRNHDRTVARTAVRTSLVIAGLHVPWGGWRSPVRIYLEIGHRRSRHHIRVFGGKSGQVKRHRFSCERSQTRCESWGHDVFELRARWFRRNVLRTAEPTDMDLPKAETATHTCLATYAPD